MGLSTRSTRRLPLMWIIDHDYIITQFLAKSSLIDSQYPFMLMFHKIPLPGNSAVGSAYKSGGLGVPGSNPGCPTGEFTAIINWVIQQSVQSGDYVTG